jgi:hypothetical protein
MRKLVEADIKGPFHGMICPHTPMGSRKV